MSPAELEATARELVRPGKGILAADESLPTIEKRLKAVGVAPTDANRRTYREILLTTPGLHAFVSGVILFEETLRQEARDGALLAELLKGAGILPGIKVDRSTQPLAGFPGEKITVGLDDLRARLAEYAKLGARFTKWRAVLTIGPNIPTRTGLASNAHALARFAALSQEAGLVPIVEPEVLMDGDHPLERHYEVTETMLKLVFQALFEHRVRLEAMLLKPNMVLSGKACPQQATVAQVADATMRCMRSGVPASVPGIVFLSGGQSEVQATEHLNAMNRSGLNRTGHAPWELSFSFGRALQAPALKTWAGNPAHVRAAQQALLHRAKCNSEARRGMYTPEVENAPAGS